MPIHRFLTIALLLALSWLAACGDQDQATNADPPTTASTNESSSDEDEDHDDDEHDDEDHDDDEHDDDHDDSSSGLGAHEHGVAEMTVAWIEGEVAIELISPTYNVFGFEYEPETDEDLALAADQTESLTLLGTIAINDEAGCTLSNPVSTNIEQEDTHSEITAAWLFTCSDPDKINVVDATGLFAAFPNFEDIDVQWVSESDQSSAELSPQTPTLSLEP